MCYIIYSKYIMQMAIKLEDEAIARITDSKNVQKWHYLCISHIMLLGIEVLVKHFVFLCHWESSSFLVITFL